MSTKTTFKRVALVAVASLGFGVLTSIAPANANAGETNFVSVGTNTVNTGAVAAPIASGTAATFQLRILSTAAITVVGNTIGVNFTVTAGPEATNITSTCTFASTNVAAGAGQGAGNITSTVTAAATGSFSVLVTAVSAALLAAVPIGTASCPTTIGGVYLVTATVNAVPTAVGMTFAATAPTTVATGQVNVSGVNVSQGITRSTTAGAARTGGVANVIFTAPTRPNNAQVFTVSSSGVGSIAAVTQGVNATVTPVNGSAADFSAGARFVAAGDNLTSVNIAVASAIAGVQTISTFVTDSVTGIQTLFRVATITWGAAAVPAVSTTTARLNAAGGVVADGTDTPILVSRALTTQAANIVVTVRDALGGALNGQTVSATITGSGLITAVTGAAAGAGTARAASVVLAGGVNQASIQVNADGTAGVGTITISVGTTVVATKTVTFHGAVATLTATQGVGVMRSGRTPASDVADFVLGGSNGAQPASTATTRATATNITIVAKDAGGNVVPGPIVTAVNSNTSVISDVTITSCAGGALLTVCAAGGGYWIASTTPAIGGVSGAAATVTFRTPGAVAGTFISTAALPFTLGGTKTGGTVTMTLDKTTYDPGEKMIITYTAKDAAGNPVQDWTTVGTPSSNKAIVGLNAAGIFVAGSHIYGAKAGELTYAPVTPGAFVITLGTGTATGATITATATVGDDAATGAANAASDAAAEAIDAANAATDAANLAAEAADAATVAAEEARDAADAATAAVEALATEVATLMAALKAQITTLANVVAKIAKRTKS